MAAEVWLFAAWLDMASFWASGLTQAAAGNVLVHQTKTHLSSPNQRRAHFIGADQWSDQAKTLHQP